MLENSKKSNNQIDNTLVYLIATSQRPVTRTDLAQMTGLSKMTISNHVNELIKMGLISERCSKASFDNSLGRRPIPLSISPSSPCILGILIKRGFCQSILADISGNIIDTIKTHFDPSMTREQFLQIPRSHYDVLSSHTKRRIMGCGISSVGPVNNKTGYILTPPNFYGIHDIPIVSVVKEYTGLPTFLIHDADAGALVEKLYGKGVSYDNFVYLHIANGMGAGFILNGKLFCGFSGKSGEIGHTSINFNGPSCSCGKKGCLELYASIPKMQEKISQLLPFFKTSAFQKLKDPDWNDILRLALADDPIASITLDEFCTYLGHALTNTLTLLDFSTIIIGYDSPQNANIIEKMLYSKLRNSLQISESKLEIFHSHFNGDAPLIGSIAVVANEIFAHNLALIS